MNSVKFLRRSVVTASLALLASSAFATGAFTLPVDTPAYLAAKATSGPLTAVTTTGERLVAVGRRGVVLVSDSTGGNWRQVPFPVSSDLTSVSFPTPQNGWIVGQDGVVLRSDDGGETWIKQADGKSLPNDMLRYYSAMDPEDPAIARALAEAEYMVRDADYKPLLDVWFENANEGFVIGEFGVIFKTSNGGKDWLPWLHRVENPQAFHLHQIRKINDDLFIVGERGLLLKYDSELETFVSLDSPYEGSFTGITGNDDFLVIHGMRGHAYKSLDGGMTWEQLVLDSDALLNAAVVLENGDLVLVGDDRSLLHSKDEGASFTSLIPDMAMAWYGASRVPGFDNIALVGSRGVRVESLNDEREE